MLAIQIDFVFACDVPWLRVLLVPCVYLYFAIGDALAFAVWDTPITKDVYVGPLPLSYILSAECFSELGKQDEFPRSRSAIDFG